VYEVLEDPRSDRAIKAEVSENLLTFTETETIEAKLTLRALVRITNDESFRFDQSGNHSKLITIPDRFSMSQSAVNATSTTLALQTQPSAVSIGSELKVPSFQPLPRAVPWAKPGSCSLPQPPSLTKIQGMGKNFQNPSIINPIRPRKRSRTQFQKELVERPTIKVNSTSGTPTQRPLLPTTVVAEQNPMPTGTVAPVNAVDPLVVCLVGLRLGFAVLKML
jgi:hypothetical protein